jgi:hypothetical protein
MSDEITIREMLFRIEGTCNLIRAEGTRNAEDIRDLRERAHGHSNRIQVLEADKHLREGERKGTAATLRVMQAITGIIGISGFAAIIKVLTAH